MGIKKRRVEELERHVERKFFVLSALALGIVIAAILAGLLGNK